MSSFARLSNRDIVIIILVAMVMGAAFYFTNSYKTELSIVVGNRGLLGVVVYTLVTIVATVVAPISTLPLLPIASLAWGPMIAALLSVAGWTIGAVIAFLLARRYGKPIVGRLIGISNLDRIEDFVPPKHLFASVLLLRMAVPVDLLSYAVGLFTPMALMPYTIATVLGVAPFAFLFSYAVYMPVFFQVTVLLLAVIAGLLGAYAVAKNGARI